MHGSSIDLKDSHGNVSSFNNKTVTDGMGPVLVSTSALLGQDTNGDGKITRPWNVSRGGNSQLYQGDTAAGGQRGAAPVAPFDPKLDTMVSYSMYSVIPSPVDDSVWGSVLGMPGQLVRLVPGSNPPATALAEVYDVPFKDPKASVLSTSPKYGNWSSGSGASAHVHMNGWISTT